MGAFRYTPLKNKQKKQKNRKRGHLKNLPVFQWLLRQTLTHRFLNVWCFWLLLKCTFILDSISVLSDLVFDKNIILLNSGNWWTDREACSWWKCHGDSQIFTYKQAVVAMQEKRVFRSKVRLPPSWI